MKTWHEFYNNEISWGIYLDKLADHKYYLEKIIELKPKKVLEVGCGPGTRSVFLSYLGIDVVAVDNDQGIVDSVAEYNKKLKGKVDIQKADAFNLPFKDGEFDIVFNAGFLEHFNDKDKIALVKEFTRVGDHYIFMVPNKAYRLKPYGNEDLLTKSEWEEILKDFNINKSSDICKSWSNSKIRRVFEVLCYIFKVDIRQKLMYYAKVSSK
jgi:SAM-dependent methyltransferase